MQQHCKTLQSESAIHEDVITAGLHLMVAVHGGSDTVTLAVLGYTMSLGHRFQTERLPPSDGATCLHAVRVHLQAVVWCTLGKSSIQATDWGWQVCDKKLTPIKLQVPVAPDNMLSVVSCQCRKNCSSAACSCRKHGLQAAVCYCLCWMSWH